MNKGWKVKIRITEYATNGPHIDSGRIMSGTEQDLRSPIPESNDLVGVAFERDGESTTKAKVGDFENTLILI